MHLEGSLRCADEREVAVVTAHLPAHVAATRAEPGCVRFEVDPTDDPLVWTVREAFDSVSAFRAHGVRAAGSPWGAATAGIERRYEVEGL